MKFTLVAWTVVIGLAGCRLAETSGPMPMAATATSVPTPVPPATTEAPPTATSTPPAPTAVPLPERHFPAVIKADFEASPRTWIPKMGFLKDVGINTIIIHLAYLRDSGDEYELVYPSPRVGPPSEEYVRQLVLTAREEGLAVMLGPMVGRIGDPHVPIEQIDDWNRFRADSVEIVVQWAAIAEELQVEYYMPFCELNAVLFAQEDPQRPGESRYTFDEAIALLAEWDGEALPRIRAVFSGKLISQIYSTFPGSLLRYPVAGYDIFGLAYKPHGVDGVTTAFRAFLDEAQTLAQREGVDWMVVEMDVALGAEQTDRDPLEAEAELWDLAAEEYLAATVVPPVGFGTSLDWTVEGYMSDEGTPSEDVLRGFFIALDEAW